MKMIRTNTPSRRGKAALVCALGLALSLQTPSIAFATSKEDLQKQMEQARQTIATLSSEAELAEYDLLAVTKQLESTKESIAELDGQIPGTQEHLNTARAQLASIIADNYKNGTPTLLDVLMDTASFDDFVLRIEYANRVAEYKRGVVDEVRGLSNELELQMNELENERANQEALAVQHEQRLEAAEKAASSAASYYKSLSTELQEMIAAEQAAERARAQAAAAEAAANAQRAAAAEAAARSQQQGSSANAPAQQGSQAQQQPGSDTNQTPQQTAQPSQPSQPPIQQENAGVEAPEADVQDYVVREEEPGEESSFDYNFDYNFGAGSIVEVGVSDTVSEFVSRAFSIVGAGYQWSGYSWTGNTFTSAFTCSGVIDFARGYPSRSSAPETLYAEVGPRMVYNTSQLNYGDLCFYAYGGRNPTGHVGIYIGGGQIIDSIPNGGVSIRDVNYMTFVGGGPIF